MTKIEYPNSIKTNLTKAEALCADLRKLRILQKLAKDIPNAAELVSAEALSKTITAKETELKAVRGELQKARRIVKHLEEIEAIENGTEQVKAPAKKAPASKAAGKPASTAKTPKTPKTAKAATPAA